MASAKRQQEIAAEQVSHLPPDQIQCRYCGESTASSGSIKGYFHKYGPTTHIFIAATPQLKTKGVKNYENISKKHDKQCR